MARVGAVANKLFDSSPPTLVLLRYCTTIQQHQKRKRAREREREKKEKERKKLVGLLNPFVVVRKREPRNLNFGASTVKKRREEKALC